MNFEALLTSLKDDYDLHNSNSVPGLQFLNNDEKIR